MKKAQLERYHHMRDFDATAEPRGEVRASGKGRAFVIQRHNASRLHFDFRLELDGVLKSWAIPKGPSLVPGDKRLAVEVEDHPLDYADFEGVIAPGQYGAGNVLVWDRGTWNPKGDPREGLAKGRLSFSLDGTRLHGGFALIRMRGRGDQKPQWLLIKERDKYAAKHGPDEPVDPGPLPELDSFGPQLATLDETLPRGKEWVFEPKLDGYRAISGIEGGRAQILSRKAQDWSRRFGDIRDALQALPVRTAVLDGEICALDAKGNPSFRGLQKSLSAGKGKGSPLVYFVFDLLYLDGVDLRGRPLETRKALLESILEGQKAPLSFVAHAPSGEGKRLYELACKTGLEGVVAKRKGEAHRAARTRDWIKVKCQNRQELIIVGFTAPGGGRAAFGALLLGVRERGRLRYAGKVGTGFSEKTLADLGKKLSRLVVTKPPVEGAPRERGVTWVRPSLVAEIRFTEWTDDGLLRHPAFIGLREDKAPGEVVVEGARADESPIVPDITAFA